MQAIGRQPRRAPDGARVHYERHRPEQTTLFRLAQQHAATFFAKAQAAAGTDLPELANDNFDAFLECSILAQGHRPRSSHAGRPRHERSADDQVLVDRYLVRERGEIVQRGRGVGMEAEGVRQKMSI